MATRSAVFVAAVALGTFWPGIAAAGEAVPATQEQAPPATGSKQDGEAADPAATDTAEVKPDHGGLLQKPIEIGDDVTLVIGGFAKLDAMRDLDPVGNADQFKVNSIPVDGTPEAAAGPSTNFSAKQTRLSFDTRASEAAGGVRVYLEVDFFGSGTALRMRHGYGEWRGLLGGQNWTTFMDITSRPTTLDYEGPDSETFVRQPMLRYTASATENLSWSVALEDPDSQIATSSIAGSGRSSFPDFITRVRYERDHWHLQGAAMVRQIRFVSDDGLLDERTAGYGFNLSGRVSVTAGDALMGNVAFGPGVGRYIESFNGTSSDAVLTGDGDLVALDAWSFLLGYTHRWSDHWESTISGGMASVDNHPSQTPDAIHRARSFHLNLIYAPQRLVSIGGEFMWGRRQNFDGALGEAVRLQLSVQYNLR